MPTTVHITDQGNQTISGNKTFDDSINFSSGVKFLRDGGTADNDIDLLTRPFLNSRVSIGTDTGILGQSINTLNNEREIKIWETGGAVTLVGYGPYIRIGRSGVLISEKTESKVGIGTLFPTEKVHISGGNLRVENNLQVSGTGIFNAIDLNNIDNLSLSGVDITITSGVVSLTNRPTVNGTGVLLSGQNVFVLQGGTPQSSTQAGANYIGLGGAHIGWSNNINSRRVPILENCVARKVSITLHQDNTLGTSSSNITGALINTTQGLTGIISTTMNSTNDNNFYNFTKTDLNIPFSAGDNSIILIHNPAIITNLRVMVNVYFYN